VKPAGLRTIIFAAASSCGAFQGVACTLGSIDFQRCAHNEMVGNAGSAPGITSRPNPQGGYDYSNGVTSRANPLGGFDYSNGVTCRRNPFGGLDCR
jgi:hypothetical protein